MMMMQMVSLLHLWCRPSVRLVLIFTSSWYRVLWAL
jgi:hypothetical protein